MGVFDFAPQCCDAAEYLRLGSACAARLSECWTPLRPVGAVLYFSLPYRLGLPPGVLAYLNLALIGLSICAARSALGADERGRSGRGAKLACWAAPTAAHVLFLLGAARNSVSDVPAACLALVALWLLLGALPGRGALARLSLSGVCLGLAVLVRAFYLHPALLAAATLVGAGLWTRRQRPALLGFCLALAAPIVLQTGLTLSRTGELGFIDPARTAWAADVNLASAAIGYDTLVPAERSVYDGVDCFSHARGVGEAWSRGEWRGLACLLARRQGFYFGSYAWLGRVYLSSASERRFWVGYAVLHGALGLAALRGLWRRRSPEVLACAALLAAAWAQASLIIPESRFLAALHVSAWTLGLRELLAGSAARPWRRAY